MSIRVEGRGPKVESRTGGVSTARKVNTLVPLLLRWFAVNARDLPWRRTLDPYAIWISEVMLQQTQVKTVIPYWECWMRALPDVPSLATAKPAQVLKLWEGLGYYTRARNLQKAAQHIAVKHAGSFPDTFDDILALPGVGRYTAGAVSSIAFNQPKPILDGNVIRVLTRLFGLGEDPREKPANERLWWLAAAMVQRASRETASPCPAPPTLAAGACSLLNQSLMELGALVCTPRQPRCETCPVVRQCVARREGRVERLPNLGQRVPATARRFVAFVVNNRNRFLVRQRPAGVVNAHLWEFPNVETTTSDGTAEQAARLALGTTPIALTPLTTVRHTITRYRISLEAYLAASAVRHRAKGRWFTRAEMEALPFTSAHRRILRLVTSAPTV